MMSKIKYIYDDKDNRVKSSLLEQLNEYVNKSNNLLPVIYKKYYYDLLIYSKYVIERENLSIEDINKGNIDILIDYLKKELPYMRTLIGYFKKLGIYELIKKVIYEDYEIVCYKDRVLDSFIEDDKKYLLIGYSSVNYINYKNVDVYNRDCHKFRFYKDKMIDNIQNINRRYYENYEDINFKEYDSIIFINDKNYISYFDYFKYDFNKINNMIMICNYSDISKYRNRLDNIKNIIIDKDKAYIEFDKINLHNSFANYDDILIGIKDLSSVSDDKIKDIINSDEDIDNISIHTDIKSIRTNSFRIGFTAYNKRINNDKKKAIRLIDNNEHITRKIRELDIEIAKQIDRMIVK